MEFKLFNYRDAILRFALGLVFLYFGFQQIIGPDSWASYVPKFFSAMFLSANNIVIMNGILEISLGTFMLLGLYTRFASVIMSIHLFVIALSVGFVPTGIRDFGLSIATFVIFLNGPDRLCLDNKFKKKITKNKKNF